MDMKEQIGWKRPNQNRNVLSENATVRFGDHEVKDVTISIGGKEIGQIQPLKIKERFGTGILSGSGIATVNGFVGSYGGVEEYSIDNGRLKQSQRFITIEKDMNVIHTISVYRNGINQIEGRDFSIQGNTIELRHPIASKDDDIEVRFQYFHGEMSENVLLLSSSLIPEDQLENFMPEYGDVFDINKLIPMNPLLVQYAGYKGRCVKAVVTQFGILGNLQLYKEETI